MRPPIHAGCANVVSLNCARFRDYKTALKKEQTITIPDIAPVMILPNALLFPNALLPLHIFEERYRKMLAWSLENDRMFCIALLRPGRTGAKSDDDFFHTAGVGLIRACVGNADGTSHLILQGLHRVHFNGFPQRTPFRIANIEPLPSQPADEMEAPELVQQVLDLCERLKEKGLEIPTALQHHLSQITDPDALSDVVTNAFVRDPLQRQHLLENLVVSERMRMLIDILRDEAG